MYIALPNNLHFEFSKKALEYNKNVIVEKPITSNYKEAKILNDLAREKKLFLFEAITTQYSSRYNSFKEGTILPAFDPEFSGGALMDLNIYNIHYVVGLFGKPKNVEYYPNIERKIDTSGILILDYEKFKCVCVGAKDCKAPIANNIQGSNGCIYMDTPVNVCGNFKIIMNDGNTTLINENKYDNRMVSEFIEFINAIKNHDLDMCYKMLEHSLIVSEVQTTARKKAGIVFKADIN